jgi:AraC family transcriptional regulator of adaptative response/methylated-DNA-[protein]-cysteine methyltransferase
MTTVFVGSSVAVVESACRTLQNAVDAGEPPPDVATLSSSCGYSASHFQRLFKQHTGVSPKAWAQAAKARRARALLEAGMSVTTTMYAAGYSSSGRFYEAADAAFGMTPTSFQQRGAGETVRFSVGACTLGQVLVASTKRGVCAVTLGDDAEALVVDLHRRFAKATIVGADAAHDAVAAIVLAIVDGEAPGRSLPLDLRGTAFQQRVWQALRAVPAGSTVSYAELAEAIGAPTSSRAVAQACGANPAAVVVPCHRVVRRDGGLSGYRWGVERKAALLVREGARSP